MSKTGPSQQEDHMTSTDTRSQIKPTPRQLRYLRVLAERSGTTFTTPRSINEASRMIEAMQQRKRTPRSEVRRERQAVSQDMASKRGDAAQVEPSELMGHGSSATWRKREPQALDAGPRVVHCKREPYDVYVGRGRGSRWGNPFRTPRDGTREQVIAKYEHWLVHQPELMAALPQLRGKILGCWCAPKPCHADVLLRLANDDDAPPPAAPEPSANTAKTHKGEPHALAGYRVGQERRLIVVQRIHGAIRVGDLPANGRGKRYLLADGLQTSGELNDLLLDYNGQIAKHGVVPASPEAIDHMLQLAA
jgi:Domain of unknown function (DUF4326)